MQGVESSRDTEAVLEAEHSWVMNVDGSSNSDGCGAGLILVSPEGFRLQYALRFKFPASNNEAQYEALLAGLRVSKAIGANRLKVQSNSQLVVNQVNGEYEAKDERMVAYLSRAQALISELKHFEMIRVPRQENVVADSLSRLAEANLPNLCLSVYSEILEKPSL
ncbi:uncharacterized protein LOC122659214 [Telopea speciosissima]|uniref:uncharacterized protein LOC122659214 n=1 Tax=Telopea speciosissima TaxID=54955 RepID=UPI001CC7547F|nr:uncharacterized protein LOC122659214 [Telopea speciosissima]